MCSSFFAPGDGTLKKKTCQSALFISAGRMYNMHETQRRVVFEFARKPVAPWRPIVTLLFPTEVTTLRQVFRNLSPEGALTLIDTNRRAPFIRRALSPPNKQLPLGIKIHRPKKKKS